MEIRLGHYQFNVKDTFCSSFWPYLASGQWEPETFAVIDHFVQPEQLTFDLGAWAGPIALYMAARGANVYALDPDPIVYKELVDNVALNPSLEHLLHPHPLAIHNIDSEVTLFARTAYGQSSTSVLARSRDTLDSAMARAVSLATLHEIAEHKPVDFIKMDIEGGEFLVLPTAQEQLERMGMPTLFVAMHYGHLRESIYRQHLPVRAIALLLQKLETFLKFQFFQRELDQAVANVLQLAQSYKYVYTSAGELLTNAKDQATYCRQQGLDLVFTNTKWK